MSARIQKVNQLIKREFGQIILREIEFPCDVLVTVTRVDTSPNLADSKIYISTLPEDKSREILKILERKIYELQQKINKRLRMRPIPKIRFAEERETVEAGKIEKILESLKNEEK